jgi:hypothetical protein
VIGYTLVIFALGVAAGIGLSLQGKKKGMPTQAYPS